MKHLKRASETLEKHLKTLENHCKHTQHPDKNTRNNVCVKHMQHPDKHTCNMRPKNTDETLVTDLCDIRVQPLQHMQHPDLLCNIHLKHLQHTS
jgi:hypothetical protein